MKKLFLFCSLTLFFWASSSYAELKTSNLAVSNKGIQFFYYDLPEFNSTNYTGITRQKLTGNDLLKDPLNNRLVLVVDYDAEATSDNLSWRLEEWNGGVQFDRDPVADEVQSEIFKGSGRLFIARKLRLPISGNDLARKKVKGVTGFEAGDGSLFNPDPAFSAHQGSVAITGRLDSLGAGEIVLFKGRAIGTAFIGDPMNNHQVTLSIRIKAKLKP